MGLDTIKVFANAYAGRRVLVTGHTGFKGSWLCHWLLELGADVHGIALAPDTKPALFDLLGLEDRLASHRLVDVRDARALEQAVRDCAPEVVMHLAAQPLVRRSYEQPAETWSTNVMGTVNLMEAMRLYGGARACVVVTSDKCYENREQSRGYQECDAMGGHDPYSSSKGATELAVSSWRRSFFASSALHIASARAGNVIGGGDWSQDRLVVDFIRTISAGKILELRQPGAVRPWQHVLEPLAGYLWLAKRLLDADGAQLAEGWNFGPDDDQVISVGELARLLLQAWGSGSVSSAGKDTGPHEAGLLRLDVGKARHQLKWHGVWNVQRAVAETAAWYQAHRNGWNVCALIDQQINHYVTDAHAAGLAWAR